MVVILSGEGEPKEVIRLPITTEYYTGSLAVDGVACHKEAQQRLTKSEGSIVHAHLHGERCNDDCVTYDGS